MEFTGDMETGHATPGRGPGDGDAPPSGLETILGRPPAELPAVLLLVGAEAEREGWPLAGAVGIAESLAVAGDRVMLCDLSVESPRLHQHLELENAEGIADVVLFGASLRHVARRAGEAEFNFVSAGPPVANAEEILEHSRWTRLIEAAAEARTKLLLYVPADSPGLESLAARVGIAIALVEAGETEDVLDSLPSECEVVPVVGSLPAGGLAVTGVPDATAFDMEDEYGAEEFEIADSPDEVEETAQAPPPEEIEGSKTPIPAVAGISTGSEVIADPEIPGEPEAPADGEALPEEETEPTPEAPTVAGGRPSSRRLPLVAGVAVLVALVVVGWYLTRGAETEADPSAPEIATAGEETEPLPLAEELPYSVAIEAHRDFATAVNRARSLDGSWEGTGFFVAPIRVDTIVYYRVMAGPIAIEQSAIALMNELVAEGDKRAASAWDVRPTRLSYRVEETADRQGAIERRDALLESGIPTYLVEMPYEGGPSRYRLYAGAYESPEHAEMMGELLAEAEIEAPLVDLTGRPSA